MVHPNDELKPLPMYEVPVPIRNSNIKHRAGGEGRSVVECLPNMLEVLSSIPTTAKQTNKQKSARKQMFFCHHTSPSSR
jgi:hypothetical protein